MSKKITEVSGTITRNEAMQILSSTGGRFFNVTFEKADGSIRELNGRFGVTKYLNGRGARYDKAKYGLLNAFDAQINDYRYFKKENVRFITFNKKRLKVVD